MAQFVTFSGFLFVRGNLKIQGLKKDSMLAEFLKLLTFRLKKCTYGL